MTCYGLKQGQDLENRAANPHHKFRAVPPLGFLLAIPVYQSHPPTYIQLILRYCSLYFEDRKINSSFSNSVLPHVRKGF